MNKAAALQLVRDAIKIALGCGVTAHEIAWITDDVHFETANPADRGKPRKPGP